MKKISIIALSIIVILGIVLLGGLLWWRHAIDEFERTPFGSPQEKIVEIPLGANMKVVARQLKKQGVISDERKFLYLTRRLGSERKIKAGEYSFFGPIVPEKVLNRIATGKVKLYNCTIPEGLRLDEITVLLEKCGYGSALIFNKLTHDYRFVRSNGINAESLEGYLFPDTYFFPKNPNPKLVIKKMVSRFFSEYKKAERLRRGDIKLSTHEAVTLASIIEKETGAANERPHISCVFHNRLRKNMRLETDPTVIYAKILRYGYFDGNIKKSDLEYVHPYNTYTVKGLPPGPIANSGSAALQAALNPIDCSDLFFVACGKGTHKFCPDFACHQKYVRQCILNKLPKK